MATITPSTTYTNGAALDIAGHNANIFSTASGKGVLSEPNGGLEQANLDATFRVRDEHVMSEEAVIAKSEGLTIPMDIYNNAFAMREDDDPVYVPIGGLNQRVYIPFDMSAVVWQWSFYVAVFRPYMVEVIDDQLFAQDIPTVAVRVYVDGVEYPAFRRPLPVSADLWLSLDPAVSLNSSAPTGQINYENVAALWYDFSKLQQNVSAGYHELSVKVYMPRVNINDADAEATSYVGVSKFSTSPQNDGSATVQSTVHTRVTFGSRSVRCVSFK